MVEKQLRTVVSADCHCSSNVQVESKTMIISVFFFLEEATTDGDVLHKEFQLTCFSPPAPWQDNKLLLLCTSENVCVDTVCIGVFK